MAPYRVLLGASGQSCSEVCSASGHSCNETTQGRVTYGHEIATDALERSGLQQFADPEKHIDEWRGNVRFRDNLTFEDDKYRTVPGLWIRSNGHAVPNWKNSGHTNHPSTCNAKWEPMRRLCACTLGQRP